MFEIKLADSNAGRTQTVIVAADFHLTVDITQYD